MRQFLDNNDLDDAPPSSSGVLSDTSNYRSSPTRSPSKRTAAGLRRIAASSSDADAAAATTSASGNSSRPTSAIDDYPSTQRTRVFQADNDRHFHTAPPRDAARIGTITLTNGMRYHIAPRAPVLPLPSSSSSSSSFSAFASLGSLTKPMGPTLRQRMEQLDEATTRASLDDAAAVAAASDAAVGRGGRVVEHVPRFEELWVNKYRPRNFTELLSDERSNREVLKWVHQWSNSPHSAAASVAVSAAKAASAAASSSADVKQDAFFNGSAQLKRQQQEQQKRRQEADRRKRNSSTSSSSSWKANSRFDGPPAKIVLLCGPPGLGKTTLAHVVARQAGYHPFEINASDNRSATTLLEAIESAIEMQPVFGDRKPNMVILDEIDGALGGGDGRNAITG
jgi:hypothetical protein